MTDNLFDLSEAPQLDPNKNYYEELVGPGKKFADNEALAKGKYHSDTYVPILEQRQDALRQENAQLREQLSTGPKLDELMTLLKTQQLPSKEAPQDLNGIEPKGLDMNEVEQLIVKRMHEREMTAKQQENERLVKSKLKERYGNNVEALKEQIESLGISREFAEELAKNSPQVFIRTFGLDKAPTTTNTAPPRNQMTGPMTSPQEERTWSFYEKMRKEKPKLYQDPKTAVQMQNDAIRLGDAFRDGDYNF